MKSYITRLPVLLGSLFLITALTQSVVYAAEGYESDDESTIAVEGEGECAICLWGANDEFGDLIPVCANNHQYHRACINEAAQRNPQCPSCREPLLPEAINDPELLNEYRPYPPAENGRDEEDVFGEAQAEIDVVRDIRLQLPLLVAGGAIIGGICLYLGYLWKKRSAQPAPQELEDDLEALDEEALSLLEQHEEFNDDLVFNELIV